MDIVKKADAPTLEEIERTHKPMEYREGDYSGTECLAFGFPVGLVGHYRVAVVYSVDREDANKMKHVAKILGPATGDPQLTIPCGGNVEWAWIQEAMELRVELLNKRRIDKRVRLQELQGAINRQLPDVADNMEKQKVAASTYGYGGHLQRSLT